jgi:ABC-type transport system substrate-binding protein
MGGSGPGNFDVDSMCTMQLLSTNTMSHGRNFAQYNNPKFDELLIKGRGTGDPEERLKVYAEMWEIFFEDAPDVLLYAINDIVGYRANVHDVVFDAAGYQWCHHAWKD